MILKGGHVLIGHNRLSILDLRADANQPMVSRDGRYVIAYNGEIYNHWEIRRTLELACRTTSDTETILEGYAKVGDRIFDMLEGMFALVIYDTVADAWICSRDAIGIKPLYIHRTVTLTIIGSEPGILAGMVGLEVDQESVAEWRVARRPCPGASFFKGLQEVLPGQVVRSDGTTSIYWVPASTAEPFRQERFEELLAASVNMHELSDVTNVSLLSAGLDSAVITALSGVKRAYCIGLAENNEILGARDTARTLNRELVEVLVTDDDLIDTWRKLVHVRREPLSVPNEGLIYLICKRMSADEKVVLTGEGADELLFGYDGIFRWALTNDWPGADAFLRRYGYSDGSSATERLSAFIEAEKAQKTFIEFLEDFFYKFHLPGLLRRMDFASMAASKESRVPFVSRDLIAYMYRRPAELKLTQAHSKLPLRNFAGALGLQGALARKKIGFSATLGNDSDRKSSYERFQDIVLGELGWS